VTCCSGSGEILVVPREGGVPAAKRDEGEAPGPGGVISSWEEFFGFSSGEDADEAMRERMHNLRSRPYVAAVQEERVEEELERLREDPRIVTATRNWRVSLASPLTDIKGGASVDLTEIARFLGRAGLLSGWHPDPPVGPPVRVGVLDSGVDPSAVCCDVLDPLQIDAAALGSALRTNPHDPHGHGSVVAGIIHLLAPTARITSVRCFGRGAASLSDVVYGLLFARLLDEPIDIFNMSFSVDFSVDRCPKCKFTLATRDERTALRNLFHHLRTELDDRPIFVGAAGNTGGLVAIPAALEGVIAVGSTGASPPGSPQPEPGYDQVPAAFLLAPGGSEAAPVATPRGLFAKGASFGTSFATAVVSGVLAALLGSTSVPGAGVIEGRNEARRQAAVEALRHVARTNFADYEPERYGMGVIG
jgi:hypothetical protein